MNWVPTVSGSIKGRVLAPEYLLARGDAWDRGQFDNGDRMDPCLTDFRGDLDVVLWLAFMAGSDWERDHRGRRYNDETTSTV